MKDIFFYDTEFMEVGSQGPLRLISIAFVSLGGREFYAVSEDFQESDCNDWVKQNVLPRLPPPENLQRLSQVEIANQLLAFIGPVQPVFWANYGSFDHVLLTQLFGTFSQYPKSWPHFTRDFQMLKDVISSPLPQAPGEHEALVEARWLREAWLQLKTEVESQPDLKRLHPWFDL